MTPEQFELLKQAARTLLAHRDAGRKCSEAGVRWAEGVLGGTANTQQRRSFEDLTGNTYGRLRVVQYAGVNHRSESLWQVRCACGVEKIVSGPIVKGGGTISCGCQHREIVAALSLRHGKHETRTYRIWAGAVQRCTNEKNKAYPAYGGAGIQIADRWRTFENVLADMGECPDGMSLDRFPNQRGNYEPGNCRWATRLQQARNTTANRLVTFNGETLCLAEWAERSGVNYTTLCTRLHRGWDFARAIGQDPHALLWAEQLLKQNPEPAQRAEPPEQAAA